MKKFKYSDNNKQYHTLDYYYKQKYNSKVFKVSLNAGFSCPNINTGGCIYCTGNAEYAGNKEEDLITQFNKIKEIMHKKWPKAKYIGYFGTRTNTYASVVELKEKFEPILKLENVVGLNIATRPDSISDDCLNYLTDLNKRTDLTIELGLQTIYKKSSELINRKHSLECFEETVIKLRERNINIVVHIINGLPYETEEMMINTVKYLNNLDIKGIKIHMLHILKNTPLASLYEKEPFHILTKEEYVRITCEQLRYLRPEIVINRITGDPKVEDLIEPDWLIKKFGVLNEIDKYMVRNDIYQGDKI